MIRRFKYLILFSLVVSSAFTTSCSKDDNTIEITDPIDPTDPEDPDLPQTKEYSFDFQRVVDKKSIKEDQVSSIGKLAQLEEKAKLFTPKKITLDYGFIVFEYENEKKKDYGLKIENDKLLANFYGQEYTHFATLDPIKQTLTMEQSFYEWFGFNAKEYVTVNLTGQEYNYSLEQNLKDFAHLEGRKGNFLQVQLVYTLSK